MTQGAERSEHRCRRDVGDRLDRLGFPAFLAFRVDEERLLERGFADAGCIIANGRGLFEGLETGAAGVGERLVDASHIGVGLTEGDAFDRRFRTAEGAAQGRGNASGDIPFAHAQTGMKN